MLSKSFLVLLFCCVYGVVSISPFFEKGQRPELYELMDNEIPTLRVDMPVDEFDNLSTMVVNYKNRFETKNATMTFEINGNISSFKKINFKIAGSLSLNFPRYMYNIKIKNGEKLYGRRHFKLRSDMLDSSFMRSKLVSDIRNRVGIKSISSNYVQFYINDKFMGLYVMTDMLNLPWIEDVYEDEKSTNLYKCIGFTDFKPEYYDGCENKNDDVTDNTEWINFLEAVDNAKSASDLEDIFDIDHFMYEMAIDYLTNAYDHYDRNFNMYKQPNGKWTYISYDFDNDFSDYIKLDTTYEEYIKGVEYANKGRFYDLFISQNLERFNAVLKDVINKAFNPAILYPHIDEIKEFIKPYMILNKTPDSDGKYPGVFNKDIPFIYFTLEQWDESCEFFANDILLFSNYGLKYIILMKYRHICNQLNMECDPIYMDENYLNENIDYDKYDSFTTGYEIPTEIPIETEIETPIETPTETPTEFPTEFATSEPVDKKETEYIINEPGNKSSSDGKKSNVKKCKNRKIITKTRKVIKTVILNN